MSKKCHNFIVTQNISFGFLTLKTSTVEFNMIILAFHTKMQRCATISRAHSHWTLPSHTSTNTEHKYRALRQGGALLNSISARSVTNTNDFLWFVHVWLFVASIKQKKNVLRYVLMYIYICIYISALLCCDVNATLWICGVNLIHNF